MDLRQPLVTLFTETFEGVAEGADGTFFVQGKEALLPILRRLTPEQASCRASDSTNSIAAHAIHTAYYISLLNELLAGRQPHVDWEASWQVQEVDDARWSQALDDLETQYRQMRSHLGSAEPTEEDHRTYLLAQLAHAAFHLGSIRQLAMAQFADFVL